MVKKIVKDNFEKQFTAIAFVPLNFYSKGAEDKNAFLLETHINVMLATQELNIPCVNAYTGYSPGNFSHFFRKPDDETLCYWIKYNKTDFNIVQRINELDKKEKYRKPIHLKAPNGKFVCVDERLNNLVFANREKAGAWETFSLICFENNENALLAHSNFFLSEASIEQDNISANATKISEYELFSIIESASNLVSFKGPNNQFLSMDESTFQIAAKADSIGENEKFIMINEFENDKKIIDKYEIYIKAYNNKYVCADESFNNIVIANREEVGGWETFLLILFENNRCALRAGSGLFLSTELNEDGAVFAINEGINAREMFSLIEFDNSFVAFEAANGKYLSFDEKTLRIMANANSSGRKEKFLMKKYLKD